MALAEEFMDSNPTIFSADLRRSDIPWYRRPITNDQGKLSFSYFVWWMKLQIAKLVIPR
jgi:hypothetical protein